MFTSPAITWTVTIALLLSGSYYFLQAVTRGQLTDRVNSGLHGLMHTLMAAMLWNLAPSTRLAQITVLGCAAFWFVLQAVLRPQFRTRCATSQGWAKCLYHGLAMAGAALMIIMMGQGSTTGQETSPSDGTPAMAGMAGMHDHHGVATPAATSGFSPDLALLSTIFFAAAALIFTVLLLRRVTTKTASPHPAGPRPTIRTDYTLEALGATIMALMFATMTT